ncbi:7-carboxy-7-deazaguanine synthase QueE [Candidatus Sulfurimonas baltica]|uniref:7-carboxy-7-deazaguanine synthase n=1 Tax=Candidatus Sulfurimonas baltica TaxID=2740404 RepID=A0A7S7RMW6_9BACT|nr:7-carboxy-7-deazaguanine synthase QueE [Candidatus Sulfurimonas baltica]QOY51896.1 7-carboxy-7-deazaguanine synthase QueE [Candidatus Sulfurimonas baltica]
MIYLVEHFYSIQGEGKYIGTPSLFFRFGGCNMKCEGFGCEEVLEDGTTILGCDTIHAVNKQHFSNYWTQITKVDEILSILSSYKLPPHVDIVLTGGEPLIYANEPVFIEFLNALHVAGHRITFETNGSLHVDFLEYPVFKECIFALSVKLYNSGEPLSKRVRGEVLKSITSNAKETFFKFTIGASYINIDLEDEISSIVKYAPKTQIFCMPLGGSKKEVEANTEPLVEFCKLKGYNFSDRLHMRIWDKEKGV